MSEPPTSIEDRVKAPPGWEAVPFPLPDRSDGAYVRSFALGAPEKALSELLAHGDEIPVFLQRAVAKRQAEFLAGRRAAALALRDAGAPATSIGRNADGSAMWPPGFVGSISHGGGRVAAIAASSQRYAGLGIDVESLLEGRVSAEVRSSVVVSGELDRLSAPPVLSEALLTLAFSAKESLYKCLRPLVGRFFGFHDALLIEVGGVEVGEDSANAGYFRLKLATSLGSSFPAGWDVTGRFLLANGRMHTAVGVRQ